MAQTPPLQIAARTEVPADACDMSKHKPAHKLHNTMACVHATVKAQSFIIGLTCKQCVCKLVGSVDATTVPARWCMLSILLQHHVNNE
eukprot:19618-Heterococcus_DN1.PRE.1